MPHRSAIAWNADNELEVLTFDLGDETFAVEAILVREILDTMPQTRVPGASPLADAVANFRGRIIPLADLALAFGMEVREADADSRVVVIEIVLDDAPLLIGIRTDRVNEVATLSASTLEPPPEVGLRWPRRYVRGLVRRDEALVVLPDLSAIFLPLVRGDATATLH